MITATVRYAIGIMSIVAITLICLGNTFFQYKTWSMSLPQLFSHYNVMVWAAAIVV